jgi:hypothetical protein
MAAPSKASPPGLLMTISARFGLERRKVDRLAAVAPPGRMFLEAEDEASSSEFANDVARVDASAEAPADAEETT